MSRRSAYKMEYRRRLIGIAGSQEGWVAYLGNEGAARKSDNYRPVAILSATYRISFLAVLDAEKRTEIEVFWRSMSSETRGVMEDEIRRINDAGRFRKCKHTSQRPTESACEKFMLLS